MTSDGWVLATDTTRLGAMISAARGIGGGVTVVAVGQRSVAEIAATAGADTVIWIEVAKDLPAEAYASTVGRAVAAAEPRAVLAATTPPGRMLLGAAAGALGAVVVSGVRHLSLEGDTVLVERTDLGGRVIETLTSASPMAGLFDGEDTPSPAAAPVTIEQFDADDPADIRIDRTEPHSTATAGVNDAERIVAIGRGVKAKADLALVGDLAAALRAEIGCSMPIADDFGWIPKERYIGRSGQHVSPRLYVAIGISGAPQHLEGVRDAKVVVAVNNDPDAHIFHRADYGIVGDLYEVIPALQRALGT
jgi:electron transfer flavoprotein alpha subunit